MRLVVIALAATACGRVGFAERVVTDAGDGGAGSAFACSPGTTAPDPLTVTGMTFEYTNFTGTMSVVPHTVVTALDPTGATLATTTSDANGAYSMAVPTSGRARRFDLRFAPPGYFTTTAILDGPLDHDVVGAGQSMLTAGDGPTWSEGSMGSVYSTTSVTLDPSKSTINIAVEDCAGNAIDGVAITMVPPPGQLGYLAASGTPSAGAVATIAPFTYAVAYDAVPGVTRISAQKAGYTFVDQTVDTPAGDQVMLVEFRPLE